MGHDEGAVGKFNARFIQFIDNGDTAPDAPVNMSGALFCSGGGLYYISSAGTLTEVAGE